MQHSPKTPHSTPVPAQPGTNQPGRSQQSDNAAGTTPHASAANGASAPTVQFGGAVPLETFKSKQLAALFGLVRREDEEGWNGSSPFGNGKTESDFTLWNGGHAYNYHAYHTYSGSEMRQRARELVSQGRCPGDAISRQYRQRALGELPPFNWKAAIKYDYLDADGTLLFQVGRLETAEGKQFCQRYADEDVEWSRFVGGTPRVLYRLPALQSAQLVIVCEGEKSADRVNGDLKQAGLLGRIVATTSPQGPEKFALVDASPLFGKKVAIFPDNDAPGLLYRDAVLAALAGKAEVVSVELSDRGEGGDYIDFRAAGHSLQEALDQIIAVSGWERALMTLQVAPDTVGGEADCDAADAIEDDLDDEEDGSDEEEDILAKLIEEDEEKEDEDDSERHLSF